MKKIVPLVVMAALFFSACTSPASALTGTWKLLAYGPLESMTPAVADADATLTFGEDGSVSGSSGCNSLGGKYEIDQQVITFGPLASTKMACDESRTAQESAVTQVLSGEAEFEIEDQTLAITNNGMVLVFSAVDGE